MNNNFFDLGRIKEIFMCSSSREATLIVVSVSFLGKTFGYIRVVLIAYFFGVSAGVDAFYVAWGAVVFLTTLARSTIDMSLLPELSRMDEEKMGSGRLLVAVMWWSVVAFSLMGSIVVIIAPGMIIRFFAFGFDAERIRTGAMMILCLIPFGIAAFLRSLVDAWQLYCGRFVVPGIIEALFNIITIPVFGIGVYFLGIFSLPISMSIGNVCLLILSLLIARDFPFLFSCMPWKNIRIVARSALASFFIIGFSGLYQITDRFFASNLESGSVSFLSYSETIFLLPNVILLPAILIYYAKICKLTKETKKLREIATRKTLSIAWGYFIPIGMLFFSIGRPLIYIWFGYGAFEGEAVNLTGLCLSLYALALPFVVVLSILHRHLLANQDLGRLILVNILGVLLNLFFDWIFAPLLGAPGIAMATTCVFFFVVIFTFFFVFPAGLDKNIVRFVGMQTFIALIWGVPLYMWGLRSELLPCIAGMASLALHLFYGDARGLFEILPEQWRPLEVLRFLVTRVRSGVSVFRKTQGE